MRPSLTSPTLSRYTYIERAMLVLAVSTAGWSPHSSWRHLSVPPSCTSSPPSVALPLLPTCAPPPARAALVNSASVSTQRGERLLGQAVPRAHRAEENRPAARDRHWVRGGCDRELRGRTIRAGQNQVRGVMSSLIHVIGARLNAPTSRLQDKASKFAGPIDVVKQVVRSEGLLGTLNYPAAYRVHSRERFICRFIRRYGGYHVEVRVRIVPTFRTVLRGL